MKRIITIQDVSCVGKCASTVALPIISVAGVEASVLPTAILSTHTQFSKFTFHDLTDEIPSIMDTLEELEIGFDAIYTGYLGSFRQLELVADFIDRFGKNAKVVVDPVMADNGVLYNGFTEEFALAMAKLCGKADLIIPNLTEASFMLGIPYNPEYDEAYIRDLLLKLAALGAKEVALTGISLEKGKIGVYSYSSESGKFSYYASTHLPMVYHGTGDVYASSVVGALMRGYSTDDALAIGVDYTLRSMEMTMADPNPRFYGVNFEEAIPYYIELLSKGR